MPLRTSPQTETNHFPQVMLRTTNTWDVAQKPQEMPCFSTPPRPSGWNRVDSRPARVPDMAPRADRALRGLGSPSNPAAGWASLTQKPAPLKRRRLEIRVKVAASLKHKKLILYSCDPKSQRLPAVSGPKVMCKPAEHGKRDPCGSIP